MYLSLLLSKAEAKTGCKILIVVLAQHFLEEAGQMTMSGYSKTNYADLLTRHARVVTYMCTCRNAAIHKIYFFVLCMLNLVSWARLLESRLILIHDYKLTEVSRSLVKNAFKI